jgi:hypothetical protein
MSRADRTAAAVAARRDTSGQLLDRVRAAIGQIKRDGAPLTVAAVRRRAGVSRSFLYQNPEARDLVATATAPSAAGGARPPKHQSGADAAWRERALNAEAALQQAYQEITRQRHTIAGLHGKVRDLEADLPADAMQRVVSDNTSLRHEVWQLSGENRVLSERLAAARDNLRSEDRIIADLQAQLLEQPPRTLRPVR